MFFGLFVMLYMIYIIVIYCSKEIIDIITLNLASVLKCNFYINVTFM